VAYRWIAALPDGKIFYSQDVYRFLEENFLAEYRKRGDTSNEPRYRNDARWAVRDAKDKKIVESANERAHGDAAGRSAYSHATGRV
jgi:hypothetical protein